MNHARPFFRIPVLLGITVLLAVTSGSTSRVRAQEPASVQPAPPRLSVLMGVVRGWQTQTFRTHHDTLLDSTAGSDLLPTDEFTWLQRRGRIVPSVMAPANASADTTNSSGYAETVRSSAEDAPAVLSKHAWAADYNASGFATSARTGGVASGSSFARRATTFDDGKNLKADKGVLATIYGAPTIPGTSQVAQAVGLSTVSFAQSFAITGPNVTLGNAVAARRTDYPVVTTGAGSQVKLAPLSNSQVGLSALVTVDQQNTAGSNNQTITPTGTGNGQSFTPSLNTLNAITVSLFTTGVASTTGGVANAVAGSSTVRVDLFASATGYTNLLASSAPVTFTNTSYQTIEFDFATLQTVTPGNVYSFRMVLVSGDRISYQFSSTSTYAGGTQLSVTTGSTAVGDVVFAEGIGSTVPEPATWAGGALLLTGAVLILRKHRESIFHKPLGL